MKSIKIITRNVFSFKGVDNRAFATATKTICKSVYFSESQNIYKNVNLASATKNVDNICKSVYLSESNDIYTNLALEDWIYKNFDLSKHHVLLLWCNSPCVVVGRHQNPWLETDEIKMNNRRVEIARRKSGGGAVYHDEGNLNLTFFTSRDEFRRDDNLEIIKRALKRKWNIKTEITNKKDIVINGDKKISGSDSRIGIRNAYHHCTLLVDTNKWNLQQALNKHHKGITTRATKSIHSPIMNLSEIGPEEIDEVIDTVSNEYLRTSPNTLKDEGEEMIVQRDFQIIDPIEYYFPGLNKARSEFASWEWRFGKTPEFTISCSLQTPRLKSSNIEVSFPNKEDNELCIHLKVESGIVQDVKLHVPHDLGSIHGDADVISKLKGNRYCEEVFFALKNCLIKNDEKWGLRTKCHTRLSFHQ